MDDHVRRYYATAPGTELRRLISPFQRVEMESTLRLIDRYLPPTGLVCDVGCGPGRYALALARRGYGVTIVDAVPEMLALARQHMRDAGVSPAAALEADAVDLQGISDDTFDAVLLLGPLYHATEATKRLRILGEARRILKHGGVLLAAYLNAWGVVRSGVHELVHAYRERANIDELMEGHGYIGSAHGIFTTCFLSTPPQIYAEVTAAGFAIVSHAGCEGFIAGMEPTINKLHESDPAAYANTIAAAVASSEMPQYRDCTEHLVVVATRSPQERQ